MDDVNWRALFPGTSSLTVRAGAGSTPDTQRRLRALPELYMWLGIDWFNFAYIVVGGVEIPSYPSANPSTPCNGTAHGIWTCPLFQNSRIHRKSNCEIGDYQMAGRG
jgi:hypothetical protein